MLLSKVKGLIIMIAQENHFNDDNDVEHDSFPSGSDKLMVLVG